MAPRSTPTIVGAATRCTLTTRTTSCVWGLVLRFPRVPVTLLPRAAVRKLHVVGARSTVCSVPAFTRRHRLPPPSCARSNHQTLGAWTTASSSAHLISATPDGPFDWAPEDCNASSVCTPPIQPWSHNTGAKEAVCLRADSALPSHRSLGPPRVRLPQWLSRARHPPTIRSGTWVTASSLLPSGPRATSSPPRRGEWSLRPCCPCPPAEAREALVAHTRPAGGRARATRPTSRCAGRCCSGSAAPSTIWPRGPPCAADVRLYGRPLGALQQQHRRCHQLHGLVDGRAGGQPRAAAPARRLGAPLLHGDALPAQLGRQGLQLHRRRDGRLVGRAVLYERRQAPHHVPRERGPLRLPRPTRQLPPVRGCWDSCSAPRQQSARARPASAACSLTNVNTCHARCAQGVPCGGHAWSSDGFTFSNLTIGAFGAFDDLVRPML